MPGSDPSIRSPTVNYALLKLAASACLVPVWSDRARRHVEAFVRQSGPARTVAAFAASRLAPCLLAFFVLKLKLPEDTREWAWLVPSPSHLSPYSVGFTYLLAGLWWVLPSRASFVLGMIAAETAAFAMFRRTAGRTSMEPLVAGVLAFWLVNPISLFHVSLGGQDEALILLAWCATAWAVVRGQPRLAGLLGAIGMCSSKILGAAAGLPLLAEPARKAVAGTAVFAGLVLAFAAALAALREPVLGFLDELNYLTSGNVWRIPEIFWSLRADDAAIVLLECAAAAVAIASAVAFVRARPLASALPQMLRLTGTVGCTFMLFSPKSPTAWLLMFLPGILFLILTVDTAARSFLIAAFLPVATFEPSLWFLVDQGRSLGAAAWYRPAMIVADGILLTGYVLLIWQGLRLRDEPMIGSVDDARPVRAAAD
jgi:hypothetical protein